MRSFVGLCGLLLIGVQMKAQTLTPSLSVEKDGFSAERLLRIDNVLQQYIDSNWIKGVAGFIAHDGKIVYNKAFGIDDINKKNPLKTDAIFRIASQTKAITSTAVMILFEEGKFLLDDPISKYIPSFANPRVLKTFNEKDTTCTTEPAKREITIRDLLTHTSGIDYAQIGSPNMNAIYAKAGIEAGFKQHKQLLADAINKLGTLPLVVNPGEKFVYSLSIDVLGRLVEVVSGKTLDVFFQERLFKPLGMTDTYFNLPQGKRSRLVQVYTEDHTTGKPVLWSENTFAGMSIDYPVNDNGYFAGGAGLVSTIKDYAAFLQLFINGGIYNGQRILSRHTVDMMLQNQIGDIPLDGNKFGLGFLITSDKEYAKMGQSPGSFQWGGFFGTSYWGDPKEKIVALIFVQQWPFSHAELHDKFKVLVYQALK
ncbi:MAG: serine hydrolase domain-containing protein [Ferruginibacter sp.]